MLLLLLRSFELSEPLLLIFVMLIFFFTWEQYHRRLLLLQTWHSEAGAAAVAERNLPQLATQHGGPCPKSHHELVMDICPTNTATAQLISWPRTHLTPAAPHIDSLLLYFILGFIFSISTSAVVLYSYKKNRPTLSSWDMRTIPTL
jgi:hypothetical protein